MPADDPDPPLRFTTASEMLAGGYRIDVYCPACNAWRPVDLRRMVDLGRGDERLIGRTWRCRRCGGAGQMQLGPPVPAALEAAQVSQTNRQTRFVLSLSWSFPSD